MINFRIDVDNPSLTYIPGDTVQGQVVIECDNPTDVKEVTLLFEGIGEVQWSLITPFMSSDTKCPSDSTEKSNRYVLYSEKERYISQRVTLCGDEYQHYILSKGTTTYPFEFQLPSNCPSSFNSKFGGVYYYLEVEIKRPLLKRNQKVKVPFTVNGKLDLNTERGTKHPQQMQKAKVSNVLACRSGHLRLVLRLPRSGFVPGEILEFSSDITNDSNRKVNQVKASLQQVVQFEGKMISKMERRNIYTVKGPHIHIGDQTTWKPDSIQIPPLPPSRLGGKCRIIHVQYLLRFEASISGLSKALFGELPVVIGTTPLKEHNLRERQPSCDK